MDVELTEATRLRLEPGDMVVCRFAGRLSLQRLDVVRAQLKGIFPDNKVVVLDEGMSLEVVTPAGVAR